VQGADAIGKCAARSRLAPEVLAEFKRRVVKRLAEVQRKPAVDHNRIRELEEQVANLTEAIDRRAQVLPGTGRSTGRR